MVKPFNFKPGIFYFFFANNFFLNKRDFQKHTSINVLKLDDASYIETDIICFLFLEVLNKIVINLL